MKITLKKSYFGRTASGKNWKAKPYRVETEELTAETYENMHSKEWLNFFKNSGSYRAYKGYTAAGYVIIAETITNDDATIRLKTEYHFSK